MPLDGPWQLPELVPVGAGRGVVRLPELQNVPVTPAVLEIIDHPHFQRLRRVRQLGPTHLVYPGATHSRFEHSVGVYGTVIRYLRSLLQRESVRASLDEVDVRTVLMAGLLHDIGHYPFAHTLEALHHQGADTPRHEDVGCLVIAGQGPGLASAGPSIAALLDEQGDLGEALSLKRQVLTGFKTLFGDEHPDTLIATNNLAVLLKKMGQVDEAEALFRKTLAGMKEIESS